MALKQYQQLSSFVCLDTNSADQRIHSSFHWTLIWPAPSASEVMTTLLLLLDNIFQSVGAKQLERRPNDVDSEIGLWLCNVIIDKVVG